MVVFYDDGGINVDAAAAATADVAAIPDIADADVAVWLVVLTDVDGTDEALAGTTV